MSHDLTPADVMAMNGNNNEMASSYAHESQEIDGEIVNT